MSSKFDWRTDEEEWDEAPTEETIPAGPSPARRWPLIVLIVAIAFGLISYLTIREVDSRTSAALDAAQANLQASLQQVVRADQEQDPELLRNVLSGRDDNWAAAAELSAEMGSLYQRESFGWQLDSEPRIITQTGTVDLTEYVVQFALDYQVAVRTGALEPLTLNHTARFRQGTDGRWLLTPPDADYWGPTRQRANNAVETTFPEIDAGFGYPFAQEVERLVDRVCNVLAEMDCVPDIIIHVDLSTDPASLTSLVDWQDSLTGRFDFVLPTPSLFGQPTTLLGQTRLRETYLRIIAQGLIGAYADYDCCQHIVFYEWLLQEQLRRLSLGPGHLPRELPGQNGLYQPVPTQLDLETLEKAWDETEPADSDNIRSLLIPLFSFLTREGRTSHTALQRSLLNPDQSFWNWLWSLEDGRHTADGLQRLYAEYAQQQQPLNQQETLLLSCIDQQSSSLELFQFNPHSNELAAVAAAPPQGNAFHLMSSSSGATYVSSLTTPDSNLPFGSWRYLAGELASLLPPAVNNQLLLSVGGVDEAIGYVVEFPADGEEPAGYLYYLDSCTADGC
ncbi:MAG: hypothetical protein KDE59_14410, partial [Anaerolineales bacterium]|nr:hypothetical protein [Anaerolineales bacterium]